MSNQSPASSTSSTAGAPQASSASGASGASNVAQLPVAEPANAVKPPRKRGKLVMSVLATAAALGFGSYGFVIAVSSRPTTLRSMRRSWPCRRSSRARSRACTSRKTITSRQARCWSELDDAIPSAKLAQAEAKLLAAQADQAEAERRRRAQRQSGVGKSFDRRGRPEVRERRCRHLARAARRERSARALGRSEPGCKRAERPRSARVRCLRGRHHARAARPRRNAHDRAQPSWTRRGAPHASSRLSSEAGRSRRVVAASRQARAERSRGHAGAPGRGARRRRARTGGHRAAARDLAALELSYTKIVAPQRRRRLEEDASTSGRRSRRARPSCSW